MFKQKSLIKEVKLKYFDYNYSQKYENPKVSIIVPSYNVELYIERCLESLISQTMKEIEIIVIDDGSTDLTPDIISIFSSIDRRITFICQENQKQGAARNRGLEIAKGEFVTFVDSDDWIDEDYCELLYNAAIKHNVNIAAASATRDYKNKIKNHLKFKKEGLYYGANDIVEGLNGHLETSSKLYKFDLIKDLRFEENVLYKDAPYSLRAICKEGSMVTVPNAHYHYYSNPTSTMKQKLDIKRENDKISTNLDLLNIAEENNVNLENWVILNENHFLWKIKHYKKRKDYYLFGLKLASRKIHFNDNKVFVIYNTACLGDVLLCNSLCQNIKNIFPNSKTVFVVDKNWYDVAKYQKDVDDVVIFDKKGANKGLFGLLKFVLNFKYKGAYASLITYRNERNFITAKLTNSRIVLFKSLSGNISAQEKHNLELKKITNKKIQNYPIKYSVPEFARESVKNKCPELKDYVVICTTSKREEKDMLLSTAIGLINKFNSVNQQVVFVGAGEKSLKYSFELKEKGCIFKDLTNKTTIPELGAVLEGAKCVISVDTATMHFGYAVGTPVIAVFYEKNYVPYWAPNQNLYKSITVSLNQDYEKVFNAYEELTYNKSQNNNEVLVYV